MRLLSLLLLAVLVASCAECKKLPADASANVMVHLQEGLGEKYLRKKYSEQGFLRATLTSRTENKWLATFNTSNNQITEVLEVLRADTNVIAVQLPETQPSPPANSTNSGHSKTKPIKNQ